jgi:hypothetical protein
MRRRNVTLSFPNVSRSYDPEGRRIRFWGYDSTIEVPFFLEEGIIFILRPQTKNNEAAILAAFDEVRERICAVALKIYALHRHRSFYDLRTADFAHVASA